MLPPSQQLFYVSQSRAPPERQPPGPGVHGVVTVARNRPLPSVQIQVFLLSPCRFDSITQLRMIEVEPLTSVSLPSAGVFWWGRGGISSWGRHLEPMRGRSLSVERVFYEFHVLHFAQGNGSPLQHPCLQNLHGQAGCSPRSRRESDTTERLTQTSFILTMRLCLQVSAVARPVLSAEGRAGCPGNRPCHSDAGGRPGPSPG